ncbi:hypothetical protein VTN77DRAFT_4718 [Rasamsonia byssochlamydoides]|uniref:uncharacterized protein n=1 Tax=Rasamsonia byssochlamydoides TaxID=89139 RepID=UPI00374348FF
MSTLSSVTYHLVRRGLDAADEMPSNPNQPDRPFPVLGFTVVALTAVLMSIVCFCIDYTFGKVVATLAAIEDPNPDVYVRIDADANAPKPDDEENDPEVPVPQQKPITSSLRATIAHLRARAGRWSLFRGLRMYMLTAMATKLVVSPLSAVWGSNLVGHAIARFVAEILVANLTVAWVHIVISEPSTKRFYQRIPGRKTWINIIPVAALRSLASQVTMFIPLVIGYSTKVIKNGGAVNPVVPSDELPPIKVVGGSLGIAALSLVLYLLIDMPAQVIFIRVAASMLPEEDETIVPFDRSFGGKVTPQIVGGAGKIGIVDAWRSFDWASRVRFVKLVGKVFLMVFVVGLLFGLVLILQAYFLLGDAIDKAFSSMQPVTH